MKDTIKAFLGLTLLLLGIAFPITIACDASVQPDRQAFRNAAECPEGCVCECVDPTSTGPGTSGLDSGSSSASESSGPGASSSESSTGTTGNAADPLAALSFGGSIDGWTVFRPDQSDRIETVSGVLELDPIGRSTWYNSQVSTHVGQPIPAGTDFSITAEVHAAQLGGGAMTCPGNGPTHWRLAAVNVRSSDGSTDAVHLAIGCTNQVGIQLEDKSTDFNVSDWNDVPWGSDDAFLRICRVGDAFDMLASEDGVTWTLVRSEIRPDLAGDVFAGPAPYAYAQSPNLTASFASVEFASISSLADCQ